jgi:hypothetical protein
MNDTHDTYQQPERRKDASAAMIELLKNLQQSIDSLNKKFDDHVVTQKEELITIVDKAFPEGDPDGHRRHHEAVIKEAEDRAQFWSTMRTELAKWGLIGFSGWIVLMAWQAFLQGPHK